MTHPMISFFSPPTAPTSSTTIGANGFPISAPSPQGNSATPTSFLDLLMMAGLGNDLVTTAPSTTSELTELGEESSRPAKASGHGQTTVMDCFTNGLQDVSPGAQANSLLLLGLPSNPALMNSSLLTGLPSMPASGAGRLSSVPSNATNMFPLVANTNQSSGMLNEFSQSADALLQFGQTDNPMGANDLDTSALVSNQGSVNNLVSHVGSSLKNMTSAADYTMHVAPDFTPSRGASDTGSPWSLKQTTEFLLSQNQAQSIHLSGLDQSAASSMPSISDLQKNGSLSLLGLPAESIVPGSVRAQLSGNLAAVSNRKSTKPLLPGNQPETSDEVLTLKGISRPTIESHPEEQAMNDSPDSQLEGEALGNKELAASNSLVAENGKLAADQMSTVVTNSGKSGDQIDTPKNVMPTDLVQFKVPTLSGATSKSGAKIIIELEPRSLGQAELHLSVRNDIVHAELRVNSLEAKQTVEANIDVLQRSLERAGVTVGKIDVSLNNQGSSQQFDQHRGWHRSPNFHTSRTNHLNETDGIEPPILAVPIVASTFIRPVAGRSWTA